MIRCGAGAGQEHMIFLFGAVLARPNFFGRIGAYGQGRWIEQKIAIWGSRGKIRALHAGSARWI